MDILNYHQIKESLPSRVQLVAISKTKPDEDIMVLYGEGQRVFGENRVQELTEKHDRLPKDIIWHMVGHLQRNKVKDIAPFVDTIQSGDSKRILKAINKEAEKNNRIIKVLLQIKIADEDSKYGWDFGTLLEYLEEGPLFDMRNIMIRGVMGMATFTDNEDQVAQEFKTLKEYYLILKEKYFGDNFKHISMGMSGDYPIAIEEGSTMIRLGSSLFGERH